MNAPKLNPHKRRREKVNAIAEWLALFGISSASILHAVAGNTKRRGIATSLFDDGYLLRREVSGLILNVHGVNAIYGLSKRAASNAGVPYRDIGKIPTGRMAHCLLGQMETLDVERYFAERYCELELLSIRVESQDKVTHKRPDIIWHFIDRENGQSLTVNLEIELNGKYDREQDQFFHKLILAEDVALVCFQNIALLVGYVRKALAYQIAGKLPIWKKTNGEWWNISNLPVISASWGRVFFKLIGDDIHYSLSELIDRLTLMETLPKLDPEPMQKSVELRDHETGKIIAGDHPD